MTANVLIVDDEAAITGFLKELIEEDGYRVATVADARSARAALAAGTPDIVLLDAVLPDGHGHALCQDIRADRATRHVPVIMMSACSRPVDVEKGLALGADAYLGKPFSASQLMTTVTRLLERGARGTERAAG